MDETQRARMRAEARAQAVHRSGASRNRFWAGLNRRPEVEPEHERNADERAEAEGTSTA